MKLEEIGAQVQGVLAAYRANDLDRYFAAIADDATVLIGGKGRGSKPMYESMWTSVIAAGGGVVSAEIEDLQIRVASSADAGVATFRMNVSYRGLVPDEPDRITHRNLAMTEVWFKSGDHWLMSHMDWFDVPPIA